MRRTSLILSLVAAAAGFTTAFAIAGPDDKGHGDKHGQPAGDHGMPSTGDPAKDKVMAEMMQACMEAGTPGKQHEELAKAVGTWSGKMKMWMMPGMAPMESTCVTEMKSVFGGRYIQATTKGDFGGQPFEGMGLYGYDNAAGHFTSMWCDNMGTGMMVGKGEASSDGKTITYTSTATCPVKKAPITFREVNTRLSDNESKMEMYGPSPIDGKEYKMMEILYTRK